MRIVSLGMNFYCEKRKIALLMNLDFLPLFNVEIFPQLLSNLGLFNCAFWNLVFSILTQEGFLEILKKNLIS